jgi:hypothetical protein
VNSGLRNCGALYDYELVDGSIVRGTSVGYEGLNVRFRKEDWTHFNAPALTWATAVSSTSI